MAHKLKALGLALVAVFAMSAVAASTASATNAFFDVEGNESATITGEQTVKHEFTTVAGTVKCTIATFHGTVEQGKSDATITPHYTGCTLAGIAATVNFTSCDYTLTAGETEIPGGPTDTTSTSFGSVHLVCPEATEPHITVAGSICEVTVEQQTVSGITLENTAATGSTKDDIDATIEGKEIKYNIKNGSKCPNAPANGTYSDGKYKGTATFKGEVTNGSTQLGITVT